jgi:hypothetical protein
MLTVGSNERITVVEAWRNSDLSWYRIRLTLNTGAYQEYNPTHAGSDTLYTFTVMTGYEFTGFHINSYSIGCYFYVVSVISKPAVCSLSIDLSAVDVKSQKVITDLTKSISFITNSIYCGPTFEYQVTYSPTSSTTNLMSFPISTTPSI